MSASLLVLAAGPLTTVQDGGRQGWLRFGLPASGALDPVALAVANALVGNPAGRAALELTLAGGDFQVEGDALRIALAGAAMPLFIDAVEVPTDRSYTLPPGCRFRLGGARGGARAYLAVAGGFAAPSVFGSASTHLRSGIGGFTGRALRDGDCLSVADGMPAGPELRLPPDPPPPSSPRPRVVLGPQADYFTPAAIATLLDAEYAIAPQSDRMGYRLAGPALSHAKGFNAISDATPPGSIQVPGGGQPIILMADRQTTGGYPKIATVISADLPMLGQRRPGERLRFDAVELDEAQAARRALQNWLADMPRRLLRVADTFDSEALLRANLISGVTDGETG